MNIQEKTQMLIGSGLSLEFLQEEYDNGKSFTDLGKEYGENFTPKIDRKVLKKIFLENNMHVRTVEEDYKKRGVSTRTTVSKISDEELIKAYESGMSLGQIRDKYPISLKTASKRLKSLGYEIRKQVNISIIIENCEENGLTKDMLENCYCTGNGRSSDVQTILKQYTSYTIMERTAEKILKHYNLYKTLEQIKYLQGTRSRKMLQDKLDLFAKTPYGTLEKAAKHYEVTKHLTVKTFTDELNSYLTEDNEKFYSRWIEQHINALLPTSSKGGVSRVEREMAKFVEDSFPEEEIVLNTRTVIPPQELDVYLPKLKKAIEFNGEYWHSDKFMIPNHGMTADEYHKLKFNNCKDKDVELLFVREFDWYDNRELIESEILNFLHS